MISCVGLRSEGARRMADKLFLFYGNESQENTDC
jgi:hypothetical protein